MSTWVKVHRKITEWEWYTDANTFRIFMHLILTVNYTEKSWRGVPIKAGQKITSYSKIADELSLTVQQVRTSINKLKKTNELTIESTNRFTLVTVVNWDLYQSKEKEATRNTTNEQQTDNNQITNEQQTDNNQITTTKESKKGLEGKKEKKVTIKQLIVDYAPSGELQNTLLDFIGYRASIKKPIKTERALKLLTNKLDSLGEDEYTKIKLLEQAIERGWLTVFPLSESKTYQNKPDKKDDWTDEEYNSWLNS